MEKFKSLKLNISRFVSSLAKTSARTFDFRKWEICKGTDGQTNRQTNTDRKLD